ncbi:protein YIPF5/7 [Nematocida sp. LUAm3]|nr:protein YIPF5/7 [Nematocida sp. LUAm3]KAI5176404.1 protein YIPF5/7 [Nematocida sp. LUAm2]KAI5179307.1 protein YIPF5/7 [Nematocida sp. LUAm1]
MEEKIEVNVREALLGYLPGDAPLLQELGIEFSSIRRDILRIFFMSKPHEKSGNDLTGPLLFLTLFSFILMVRGRVHLTYMYLMFSLSFLFIFFLNRLLHNSSLSFLSLMNILGYAFAPTVIFSFFCGIMPFGKKLKLAIGVVFSIWSSVISTSEINRRCGIQNKSFLLGYPILLVFLSFSIISLG